MTAPQQIATEIRLAPPCLRPLVETLPGYMDMLALAEHADTLLRERPLVSAVPAELDPFTSGQITPEWHAACEAHAEATARSKRDRERILGIKQHATAEAAAIFQSNGNLILDALHDRLTTIMGAAADIVAELGGAETAEHAIARDAGPAWKRLRDLADEYATLRTGQEFLLLNVMPRNYWTSCRPSLPGDDHANLAYIRNLSDIWPDWRQSGLSTQRINIDGSKPRQEPWPADSGPELLLWVLKSGAHVWVPKATELDALFREQRDLLNPQQEMQPQPGVLNQPLRASDDYFDRQVVPIGTAARPAELDQLGASQ